MTKYILKRLCYVVVVFLVVSFLMFCLFGVMQGNGKTNWLMVPLVGLFYFAVYFFLFRFLILKKNYATPGREVGDGEVKLYTRADYNRQREQSNTHRSSQSKLILEGLGGRENLLSVDCCATRLRVSVKDADAVDEQKLRESGAAGVIRRGGGVQVIYGPQVAVIKSELEDYLKELEKST